MPYDQFGYSPYAPRQNTYAFVSGIDGAKAFIVNPNQTVLLMDNDAPICYMKQANGIGQASLRIFKLVETTEAEIKKPQNDEMSEIKKRLEEIEKKLGEKNE